MYLCTLNTEFRIAEIDPLGDPVDLIDDPEATERQLGGA
jgi:hypothetical protein